MTPTGNKLKIVGFTQARNERQNGNLENWLKCMDMICDYIYIHDNASDDNSREFYEANPKCVVTYDTENNFKRELICKSVLLKKLLTEHPETEWIFWMDIDTLLDSRLLHRRDLENFLECATIADCDGIQLGHLNLWRSDVWYRIDSEYNYFDICGRIPFWRNNGKLVFQEIEGLHQNQEPLGIGKVMPLMDFKLIHRGFVTDEQIFNRYLMYKKNNELGIITDPSKIGRLINEDGLDVKQIKLSILPKHVKIVDISNPKNKIPLVELFHNYGIAETEREWK